ncbi:MAG: hypothetical protein EBS20_11090, partial [Actinobacteria bacterium]|nr:hypothetical protein [Actinomycetota bacterium]
MRTTYHGCKIPIGAASVLLSCLLWYSAMITCLNKFIGSSFAHGYVLHDTPSLFNPLDALLRGVAAHHAGLV